jgi:hypothetical protein
MLGNGAKLAEVILKHKRLQKDLKWLIKKTVLNQQEYYCRELGYGDIKKIKLLKCPWRYFKKNITLEKLIQILFIVYIHNFDAVKKNLFIIATKMDVHNSAQSYIYSWLRNLGGLSGNFVTALSEKPDYWEDDLEKVETSNPLENDNG